MPPDLQALRNRDNATWDEAFRWLWPVACAAARYKLAPSLLAEVEDVAIQTMEALVEAVRDGKPVEALKPLAATIAYRRAVDLIRERCAIKRRAGKIVPPEPAQPKGGVDCLDPAADSPLAGLERKELAEALSRALSELRPPRGAILTDLFLNGLSHEEVARKHGIPVGSVGVHRQRGLETLRRIWGRHGES